MALLAFLQSISVFTFLSPGPCTLELNEVGVNALPSLGNLGTTLRVMTGLKHRLEDGFAGQQALEASELTLACIPSPSPDTNYPEGYTRC